MPAAILIPALATVGAGAAAAGASIYGASKNSQANEAASAATERSNAAALAEQKRQDDLTKQEFDQQQAAAKAQWDAQQQNLAPYRAASGQALSRLGDLFGLPLGGGGSAPTPQSPGSTPPQTGSTPSATSQPSGSSAAPTVDWTADPQTLSKQIAAYYQSRGTTPAPSSVAYWVSKAPELVARGQQLGDPTYATKRLSQADEFGSATSPTGTAPTSSASSFTLNPDMMIPSTIPNALATPYSPVIPMSQLMRSA